MNVLGPTQPGDVTSARDARGRARAPRVLSWLAAAALCLAPLSAHAAPFIWDQDDNHIDDRVETVNLLGYQFAFEGADTLLRKRIDVTSVPGGLFYGVFVSYNQTPTASDFLALAGLGMPVLHRFESLPAVRSVATFAQVAAAATLPGVERVEAVPILYPMLREGAASIGVRDPSGQVFPTWSGMGQPAGEGIVVAILDTGINDEAQVGYPGHESLIGRCVGGADFTHADSTLDTPRDGSVNPSDHGSIAHGTHVAGIVLGSGGSTGFATGVAPAAKFADVRVLNDLGIGSGIAEAIDWCIHNRARDWGAGASYQGIDVINLSLSSIDRSDGNDIAARLANRAVAEGIVVVGSMGNDGRDHYVPSPAGGDLVLAVGAFDAQRTALNDDDLFAAFDNYGPRDSDGDGTTADEQKPDLMASGEGVLSADGDLSSDGAQYRRLSGTSMAAAFVSGAVAALRSAFPSLTPAQIATVLRSTAQRSLNGVPPGVTGPDPGWYSPIGFGALDLHAAMLELVQPERSQVRRLELTGAGTGITATIRTQRERGASFYVVERADDVGGIPGAFAGYDSVPAAGDTTLADGTNSHAYVRAWNVPGSERGVPFWYRVAYTEAGVRWSGPSRRYVSPTGPPAATLEVTVVHNAYDSDIDAVIEVGGGGSESGFGSTPPAITIPLPGTSAAVASEWVTGSSTGGNIAWTFAVEVPQGVAEAYLPPAAGSTWRLRVTEGGFINRVGRVTDFRVVWHAPGGDQVTNGEPLPLQTIEGHTVTATAPGTVVGVGTPSTAPAFLAGPNPVAGGAAVTFAVGARPAGDLLVYDLSGRRVGRAPFTAAGGVWRARWVSRDAAGQPLPGGLYFARVADRVARIAVIGR
jgi:subtilisin family serine protease